MVKLVSTGTGKVSPTQTTTAPDLRCWAKFVRGTPYDGEYGFDWMDWKRDPDPKNLNDDITEVVGMSIANFEYCYDKKQSQYVAVAKDAYLKRKLQNEYERILIYGEDYYAAWLSVRPTQQVNLQLHIEALNTDAVSGDYLTFGAHAEYEVTVNGQVNEAIRIQLVAGSTSQSPQVADIVVKCVKPCKETKLKVLDEKGQVVGQLTVVDNTRTYHLPIRVVYMVKDGPASTTNLSTLQSTFASLDMKKYLNTNSLNQAQIQVEFEKTNQIYQLIFKEAEWSGKFYDSTNNWYTNYTETIKNKITGVVTQENTQFLDKALSEYMSKYENKSNSAFRGILLVITDIRKNPSDAEGGVSKIRPVDFRETLIYNTNLSNKPTYSHEIGHALGLYHTFLDKDNNEITNSINYIKALESSLKISLSNKKVYSSNIKTYSDYVTTTKEHLNNNVDYYASHSSEKAARNKDISDYNKKINSLRVDSKNNEDIIKKTQLKIKQEKIELLTYEKNMFKFVKGKTKNIMDYNNHSGNSLFKWQWLVLQTDVISYYGK